MSILESYSQLGGMSENDLVNRFDQICPSTVIGLNFIRDELAHREAQRQLDRMEKLTLQMRNLTIAIFVFTFIQVLCGIAQKFNMYQGH